MKLRRKRNLLIFWVPVICWMAFIFLMSTDTFSAENTSALAERILVFFIPGIPSRLLASFHFFIRKAAHLSEYFILSLLLLRAYRGTSPFPWTWRTSLLSILTVFLWAVSDELHQAFVPSRTASVLDVGIDTAGGLLAQVVQAVWVFSRRA